MRKRPLLLIGLAVVALSAVALSQDQGVQTVVGNVFLQDTTPGTEQIGHAAIKGTFRAGQVNVSQATGTTIPVIGNNAATGAGSSVGGSFSSAQQSSIGLRGTATSTTGFTRGVYGEARSPNGVGVSGISNNGIGVFGGITSGAGAGVWARSASTSGAALIAENTGTGIAAQFVGDAQFSGTVRVDGDRKFSSFEANRGGLTRFLVSQVGGSKLALRLNTNGGSPFGSVIMQPAILNSSGAQILVYGVSPNIGSITTQADGRVAVEAQVKNFVEVDPRDAARDIVYACVEGPEAAMYTRGTGRLVNGRARVELPGHFSSLAATGGVTVTLTPGSASSRGLAWEDKSSFGFDVVELSGGRGNYEFDWEVKAVRRGYEDYEAVRPWDPALAGNARDETMLARQRHIARVYGRQP
ncbi:MAG: hypothetical protein AB7F50_07340 [Fimbriimonadaceae bacterium]